MQQLIKYFTEGIWLESIDPRKPIRSFFLRCLRVLYGAAVGFDRDQCSLKASALTFYTLLSMVPVLAVAFGIAKGFGFEEVLQRQLRAQFRDNPEVAKMTTEFAYSFLERSQGGLIAAIGIILLLWIVIKLLNNIERIMNQIWKVTNARSFFRMFTDYLAIMIICPIFIVISSILTIYLSSELRHLAQNTYIGDAISPAIYISFRLIPLVLSWLVLTLIYIIMPNARVPLFAGVMAGIIAGTVYQILQWTYIHFQIGASSYGAIYGSFAALPLFMLWVQLSWLVVLGGAEIAYQIECERNYGANSYQRVHSTPRSLGVYIVYRCAIALKEGHAALPLKKLARELGVATHEIRQVTDSLRERGILTNLRNHVDAEQFILTQESDKILLSDVCKALDSSVHRKISLIGSDDLSSVEKKLHEWDTAVDNAAQNVPIVEVLS